jgi:hypothetical protein
MLLGFRLLSKMTDFATDEAERLSIIFVFDYICAFTFAIFPSLVTFFI